MSVMPTHLMRIDQRRSQKDMGVVIGCLARIYPNLSTKEHLKNMGHWLSPDNTKDVRMKSCVSKLQQTAWWLVLGP